MKNKSFIACLLCKNWNKKEQDSSKISSYKTKHFILFHGHELISAEGDTTIIAITEYRQKHVDIERSLILCEERIVGSWFIASSETSGTGNKDQ
ncbi:hypothetical protein HNY73_007645 [Argiope bruennichi]|uniref:Uncharacterized protein n=1 Tax=Argiope bruennichi TaxID=94029 RepID=A0A8T0FF89_ARGBR|nr:hypothetical protein HNY73_007645 [Argiope bruennichi]